MSTVRQCSECRQDKALSEFSRNNASPDGLLNRCKDCDSANRAQYRGQRRTVTSKACASCEEVRPAEAFNKNRAQADGLATWCRQCDKDYRAENKDKRQQIRENWQARNQTCTEPGCDVLTYRTGHTRCSTHHAEWEARKATEARERVSRAERERLEQRSGRICAECGAEIPAKVNLDARYCGKGCRDAVNKRRQRENYSANKEAYLAHEREFRLANPHKGTLLAARNRARRLGVPFELAEDDIQRDLGNCLVCDRELVVGTAKVTPSSPTIDRIVPERGYVRGNVLAWVCFSCNARKHNKTIEQLAAGWCGPEWKAWATAYLAAQNSRPTRRVVRKKKI